MSCLQPGHRNGTIQCFIKRDKSKLTYHLFLCLSPGKLSFVDFNIYEFFWSSCFVLSLFCFYCVIFVLMAFDIFIDFFPYQYQPGHLYQYCCFFDFLFSLIACDVHFYVWIGEKWWNEVVFFLNVCFATLNSILQLPCGVGNCVFKFIFYQNLLLLMQFRYLCLNMMVNFFVVAHLQTYCIILLKFMKVSNNWWPSYLRVGCWCHF